MNDPLEVLRLAAAAAREIEPLVALVDDAARIEAWIPKWPDRSSVVEALATQDERSVRFLLERVRPAQRGSDAWWRFEYLVQFRPAAEVGEEEGGQWEMARALINGNCADGGRWLYRCFRPHTAAPLTLEVGPRVFASAGGPREMLLGRFTVYDLEA